MIFVLSNYYLNSTWKSYGPVPPPPNDYPGHLHLHRHDGGPVAAPAVGHDAPVDPEGPQPGPELAAPAVCLSVWGRDPDGWVAHPPQHTMHLQTPEGPWPGPELAAHLAPTGTLQASPGKETWPAPPLQPGVPNPRRLAPPPTHSPAPSGTISGAGQRPVPNLRPASLCDALHHVHRPQVRDPRLGL